MVEKTLNLPTSEECAAFWETYHTPQHIRRHMQQVNRVAHYLVQRLHEQGKTVNIDLVDRASLLHDTLRVTEWKTLSYEYFPQAPNREDIQVWEAQRRAIPWTIPHAQVNADIFRDHYPELARVIAMHSIGETPQLKTLEEKIVNYADRRVSHDRIVTLQERLDEAYQRYAATGGRALERQPEIIAAVTALQDELFSIIGEDADQLLQNLSTHETNSTTKTDSSTDTDATEHAAAKGGESSCS
jgi:hypothetical protein